ncbi:MAG: transcriptional regulator, LacI family [Chloroflexi bacterium]|jgi:LacI family fructose operon transcriptional repressor|nr:transcriptional regulator, LacI family [Chloroflexota bacterium]
MVGIKDVAEAAGVSTASVSRVLTNQPNVTPELREKVMAAVKQLNYRPNLVARSLRSQQSNTIGLIVSDIRNPFFTAISRAVEDTAYQQGFRVILCNTDEDAEKETLYLNLMRDENVAGIIFSPTRQTLANFSALDLNFPTVVVDRSIKNINVDSVLLDNVAAAYRLTNHLIENGYQRIGAIFGEASTTGAERRHGFLEALKDHNLTSLPGLLKTAPPKIENGYESALEMLKSGTPPEAIFTSNSMLGAGVLMAIREMKFNMPDDLALVTFDDTAWASLVQPAITVIAQPTDEIGKTATQLLLQRIAEPGRPTRKVILDGELIVRGSSAARSLALHIPVLKV